MLSTWIEAPVKGRLGGPIRAGMWSAVVVGTHPIAAQQRVWLEIFTDDAEMGALPGHWLENRGANSLWHVALPPLAPNVRVRYRAVVQQDEQEPVPSPFQESLVRANFPAQDLSPSHAVQGPEGLVGNRMMTVRVDERGATYDIYYPTVGLHSGVRPAAGDQLQSRSHFRAILGGLTACGARLDWFCERQSWDVFQRYQGATNLLVTELTSRNAPVRVVITDFVAMGSDLPRTAGGTLAPGQYFKRFRIFNDGDQPLDRALFGLYVDSEVNGGVGDPGLSWQDADRTLLATNRGHAHANRKLARDATVEFALTLDDRGPVDCEAIGPHEAMLLRPLHIPPRGAVAVDFLVSGAFTGWRGDTGTFNHWLRPALAWFRGADVDAVEHATAVAWDEFLEPLPILRFPRPAYGVTLRRSALASALHIDAEWGSAASSYEMGLMAYCWPRDTVWLTGALDRLGHPEIGRKAFEWLDKVRIKDQNYLYWYQKYTIDGGPEWETSAVDQTALIAWGLERYYRRTGDREFLAGCWPMLRQVAAVCRGHSGHPGLRWIEELSLLTSAGPWESRYGAFLYSNACAVAGLRAAARMARVLGYDEPAAEWDTFADRIWNVGVLGRHDAGGSAPGLVDPQLGRFLEARRLSCRRGIWSDRPEDLTAQSAAHCIAMLAPAVPFGLIPASDPIMRKTACEILEQNAVETDPGLLTCWSREKPRGDDPPCGGPSRVERTPSSLASLWMARYLIQLGRETGEPAAWARAVTILDEVIGRLGPLGVGLCRPSRRRDDPADGRRELPAAWDLHGLLIETILDLAAFDYDAAAGLLILDPVLPPSWPHIGLTHQLPCGHVGYRLERLAAASGTYRLTAEFRLARAVRLQVGVSCPGLADFGAWRGKPATPPPDFTPTNGRLAWSLDLPAGESSWEWLWG
jgi:hypothetical protein